MSVLFFFNTQFDIENRLTLESKFRKTLPKPARTSKNVNYWNHSLPQF